MAGLSTPARSTHRSQRRITRWGFNLGQARHHPAVPLPEKDKGPGLEVPREAGTLVSESGLGRTRALEPGSSPRGLRTSRARSCRKKLKGRLRFTAVSWTACSPVPAGAPTDGRGQRPGRGIEGRIPYASGLQPQDHLEQLRFREDRHSTSGSPTVFCPSLTRTHSEFNRDFS